MRKLPSDILDEYQQDLHDPAKEFILNFGALGVGFMFTDSYYANLHLSLRKDFDNIGINDGVCLGSCFWGCDGSLWIDVDSNFYFADDQEIVFLGDDYESVLEIIVLDYPLPKDNQCWDTK